MDGILYDAFISYSHGADGRIAPALRAGLHRFAKPWYKLRATRIFHDDASMITDSSLWDAILRNLQASRHFIYLASPAAAASRWVQQEIGWWLDNRSRDTMLIVLTEGELIWDPRDGDWDWSKTTSFPREIQHGMTGEPLWLDLRWARGAQDLTLGNPDIRSAVADLSAALTGRSKDELIGEDVRLHRQTRRIAWTAAASLAILAVISTVAAFMAVENQLEAEDRSRLAQSRQLATQSKAALDAGALDRALLLALESGNALNDMHAKGPADDHDARAALMSAMHALPNIDRYLARGRNIGKLQVTAGGLISAIVDNVPHLWRAVDLKSVDVPAIPETVEESPIIDDFRRVFPANGGPKGRPVLLRDATTGSVVAAVALGRTIGPSLLTVSADGSAIAAKQDVRHIQLWKAGKPLTKAKVLRGHREILYDLAFSADGSMLASASADGTVRVWDVETGELMHSLLQPGGNQVESVAFSPDGQMLAAGSGARVQVFNPRTGEQVKVRIPFHGRPNELVFHPDGSVLYIAGSTHSTISRIRIPDGTALPPLVGHSDSIRSLAIDPEGRFLMSNDASGTILVWRDPAGDGRVSIRLGDSDGGSVAIAPDGSSGAAESCVAAGREPCAVKHLTMWQLDRGAADTPLLSAAASVDTNTEGWYRALSFTPDGTLISAACAEPSNSKCRGLSIRYRDHELAETRSPVVIDSDAEIGGVAFLQNASRLAYTVVNRRTGGTPGGRSQNYLRISDSVTGDRILDADPPLPNSGAGPISDPAVKLVLIRGIALRQDNGRFTYELPDAAAAFAPDGETVVSIDDPLYGAASVRTWDATDGAPRSTTATSLVGNLIRVSIAPDGRTLVIADADGQLIFWDLVARAQLGPPIKLSKEPIFSMGFAENGGILIATGREGRLFAVDLDIEILRRRACNLAGRNLTYEEWSGVFGERPYEKTCSDLPVNPSLREAGLQLAQSGDIEGAISLLLRAKTLGDHLVTDPVSMARTVAVDGEIARGDKAADAGGYESALTAYRRAVELGAELAQTPEQRAGARAALYYRNRGGSFARENDAVRSIAAFDRATALDSNLAIDDWEWARLCAAALMQTESGIADRACASAVRISNDRVNFHDLLALTLAINGRIDDAETSFQAFFEFEKQPMRFRGDRRLPLAYVEKVEGWRTAMRDGRIADIAASLAADLKGRVSNF